MENQIIIDQILILAILVGVGVLAVNARIITDSVRNGIADLVFDITLPLLIITTFARIDLTPAILRNSGLVFLFAYLALTVMFAAGLLTARVTGQKGNQRAVLVNHHMFGNIVFLGFPLMNALFPGGEGLLYAAVYQLASNSVMWTLGVWIFLKGNGSTGKDVLKNLVNSNTIAFFVGIVLMVVRIKIPDLLFDTLHGLGNTTNYLSMIYIGAILATTRLKGTVRKLHVFVTSFNKLLLVPAVIGILVYVLSTWLAPSFGDIARKVVILEASMPCMATIVVMARKFASDETLATENVFVSTIAALFTLPLMYGGLFLLDRWFL
ncbi:MAG: AEC family transporter [Bacteroidota bacterium]